MQENKQTNKQPTVSSQSFFALEQTRGRERSHGGTLPRGQGEERREGQHGAYRVGLVASVGPELSGPEFVGNRITQFMGKTL